MATAEGNWDQFYQRKIGADKEATNTFWPIEFVSTEGEQVDVHLIDVDLFMSDCLCRIRMEDNSF